MSPAVTRVQWPRVHRIIRSIHPPIDLFEDIAEPEDWEALVSIEARTNPRVHAQVGQIDLVPAARRVSGPGASYLMAPFVHVSRDRPGRFTDGSYGVWSGADSEEAAIREVAHHHARFMARTGESPGWTAQFRALIGEGLDVRLHDLRDRAECHDPDDWSAPQRLGRVLRDGGSDGVIYRSVRAPGAECIGAFWPDILPVPVQGDHFDFHWDGARVDRIRNRRSGTIYALALGSR